MNQVFVIEPQGGWHAGDRAYCVLGSLKTIPPIEAGKVYSVEKVILVPDHVGDGITLHGVETPGSQGLWSSRFLKLSGRAGHLSHIDRTITRSWMEAYAINTKQPSLYQTPSPQDYLARRDGIQVRAALLGEGRG